MFEFIIEAFSGSLSWWLAFYCGSLYEYVLESNHREISRKLTDQMNRLREIEIEQKRILKVLQSRFAA